MPNGQMFQKCINHQPNEPRALQATAAPFGLLVSVLFIGSFCPPHRWSVAVAELYR
jgi:hypothetical protein